MGGGASEATKERTKQPEQEHKEVLEQYRKDPEEREGN